MSGRVLPFPGGQERRLPHATVTRAGFRKEDLRWIVACACGFNTIEHVPAEASRRKREHNAAHRAAERAHPAGKARPGGDAS